MRYIVPDYNQNSRDLSNPVASGNNDADTFFTTMIDEFHKRRERQNEAVTNENFLPYKRFFALDHQAYTDGVLPAKTKELMGLVASMVLRCNDCILYHIDRAVAEGASRDELNETMNIALIVGGSIVIPHLRFAIEALDELLPRSPSVLEETPV